MISQDFTGNGRYDSIVKNDFEPCIIMSRESQLLQIMQILKNIVET